MKGVNHYLKDGTVHQGKSHKHPDGMIMTGAKMSKGSKQLYHFGELSKNAQKKARSQW